MTNEIANESLRIRVAKRALEMRNANPSLRRGQAMMNALCEIDEELSLSIVETDLDCFYDDGKCRAFLDAL